MTEQTDRSSTRRTFIKTALASAATCTIPAVGRSAGSCKESIPTDEGPLYPAVEIPWTNDLTSVPNQEGMAKGELVYLFGRVLDPACQPVPGAVVEIWQADGNGYYKHPVHPAPQGLDPCFRYFARSKTDANGRYVFRTIVPKWYRIYDIDRAAHVHFRVYEYGRPVLTSEMYFDGDDQDELRRHDRVYQSIGKLKQELIVKRQHYDAALGAVLPEEPGHIYCNFELRIEGAIASRSG